MKEWFSAKELAGVGGLSKYPTNVTRQAKKEKWETRPMQGVKGGGFEYRIKSLPEEVQRAIRTKLLKLLKLLPEPVSKGELDVKRENISLTQITDNQLSVASGRMAVVRWYLAQEKLQGLSRTKMLDSVVAAVKFLPRFAKRLSRAMVRQQERSDFLSEHFIAGCWRLRRGRVVRSSCDR